MSFFKNIGSAVGGFFKKVATSTVGKTILGAAATLVGGPVAGAAVVKATSLLGEKKLGEMAAKVVSDGVVKTDKVATTLAGNGINPNSENVQVVTDALKSAAAGISNKGIGVSGSASLASVGAGGSATPGTFMDKLKLRFSSLKNWFMTNWKKVLLFGVLPALVVWFGYKFLFKRKKYRR